MLREDKRENRAENRAFYREHKMFRHPMMAKIFDAVEQQRGVPNGRTPFGGEIKIVKDVVYKTVDGVDLVMDIYLPSRPVADKTPIVVDIPGGGWMIHNRRRRDGYASLFAALGVAVAVIDHRLSPQYFFPENLKDVVDAVNFLDTVKDEYNLDLSDVTVTGDSSGGHLAACLGCATTNEDYRIKLGLEPLVVKPTRLIFISGAFSFETMYRIPLTHTLMVRYFSGKRTRADYRKWDLYKETDPYNYVNKDFPPSYNNGGAYDFLCLGEAKRMAGKLSKVGVENEYYVGKNLFNGGHCYVLRLPFAPARRDMLKLLAWYKLQAEAKGFDMQDNFNRVERFLNNYKKALRGDIEC